MIPEVKELRYLVTC